MQLTSLDMTPEDARDRLAAYEAQVTDERTAEDDAIRAGYRAAARGLPVIHLPTVLEEGGRFPDGLPRLAVVRADAAECWVSVNRWWSDGGRDHVVYTDRADDRGRARVGAYRVAVSLPPVGEADHRTRRGHTVVPLIPPEHRPRRRRLHRFHILWEVEAWDPTPPVDPALLQHIRGDLWAVHAVWDLTPLERAVLSARIGG